MITTDITGPLKETERGNKYFIVVIDHFTKFIQVYPMQRIQAEDVAQTLVDKWIWNTGINTFGWWYTIQILEAVYEYLVEMLFDIFFKRIISNKK